VGHLFAGLFRGGGLLRFVFLHIDQGQQAALADLLPHLDLELLYLAGEGGGDLHGGLVALQGEQRILRLHLVSRGHQDLDDVDLGKIADVGK
jgi:hypothetical protein